MIYDNGMMYQNSTVNMAEITDGTSTTILMGESIWPQGVWSQATSRCVRTNVDRTINRPIPVTTSAGTTNYWVYWVGSTPARSTSPTATAPCGPCPAQINKLTLNKLMTRAGGETISSDEIK